MVVREWLNKFIELLHNPATLIELYPCVFVGAILFFLLVRFPRPRHSFLSPLLLLSCWCILCYVAYPLHYLWIANFADHVEPCVLDTARMLGRGEPLYHDVDSASRYALLYGPNTFLLPRLGMWLFGESMTAYKLPGILLAFASLALTIAALRTSVKRSDSFRLGIIYFCGMMLLFHEKYFWVRSDPQILFWTALGVFGTSRRSSLAAAVILGIAFGACINVKIHACLLFSPLVVMVLIRATLRDMLVMVSVATVIMMLPFVLFPEISLQNYLVWLRLAASHGISPIAFRNVLTFTGMIGLPLAVEAIRMLDSWSVEDRRPFLRAHWAGLLLSLGGIALFLFLSSKNGGGEWHVMPMLPIIAWLAASAHERIPTTFNLGPDFLAQACQGSLVGLSILSTLGIVLFAIQNLAQQRMENGHYSGAIAEIRDLMRAHDHQSVAMGYGETSGYVLTYLRPLLPVPETFRCDAAALGDMDESGIPIPDATLERLRKGAVKVWLIPRDEVPFAVRECYNNVKPVFSDEFRKTFLDHYERTEQTNYFDVWTYRVPK